MIMRRIISIMMLFILIIPSFFINVGAINQTNPDIDFYVDDDAPSGGDGSIDFPFNSIEDAIDVANEGDTIFVFNGTYDDIIVLRKAVNLIGEDKNSTFLIYDVQFLDINGINFKGFNLNVQGMYLYDCNALRISENTFQGFHNLNIANSSNCIVSDNYFYGCSRPIRIRADACNNVIKNNYIDSIGDDGIAIISGCLYNKIINNLITNCENNGINVCHMSNNFTTISGNIIRNCENWGITSTSSYCTISNNIVEFCGYDGIAISWGDENIIHNNYINGNYQSYHGISLLWTSENIVTENIFVSNCGAGLYVSHEDNNHIANNSMIGNGVGVAVVYSHYNEIFDNEIKNNVAGVYLFDANLNEIKRNIISTNSEQGVFIEGLLVGNVVAKNDILNNKIGVDLEGYKNINQQPKRRIPAENYIVGNNIKNNYDYGIRLNYLTFDNHFYYNNLIDNNNNAYDTGTNTWFKVFGSKGNYWSDWEQNSGYPNNYNVPPFIIRNIDLYPSSDPYDTEIVIVEVDEEIIIKNNK